MPLIRTLKPNVTREQAIRQFTSRGPATIFRNLTLGPLRSVADLYIPFRLFRAEIVNRGVPEKRLVALDAFSGTLDLYQFERPPYDSDTLRLETRNSPPARLNDDAASELVIAKLRRILYTRGFFRMRDLRITAEPLPEELHIPYWLGFRGSDSHARITVIDAVRRSFEGAKLRRMVEEWISTTT